MAILKVQGPFQYAGGSEHAISKAFTSNVAAGNFLVAFGNCAAGSGTAGAVTDSLGQTWTKASVWTANGGVASAVFYKENTLAGACNVTLTCGSSDQFLELVILEFSGLATSASGDGANPGTGSSTAPNSGNLSTSNAPDLLVAGCVTAGAGVTACTPSGGWTTLITGNTNGFEYNIVSATGTYAATFTTDNSAWVAPIAAFKGAGAPPVTLHFALQVADTTSVAIGFHFAGHFPLQVADTTAVVLGFHVTRRFTCQVADSSGANLTFRIPGTGGHNYYTNFPLTENPISENGHWVNGAVAGLDWNNVRTTPGFAVGTQPGNATGPAQYADSTALLSGVWNATQSVTAIAKVTTAPTTGQAEVELRVLSTLSAHSCTGYELDVSVDGNQQYYAIDRWNGALGDFTLLAVNYGSPQVKDGDVVKFTVDNNGLMIGYLNGVEQVRATDTMFRSGNPGIGFYLDGPVGVAGNYGFREVGATDGTPVHFPLQVSDTSSVAMNYRQAGAPTMHYVILVNDTSAVRLSFGIARHFVLQVRDTSSARLSFRLPVQVTTGPSQLLWGNTMGWMATPYSNWIYMVSRPLVSPDQQMLFRAYKYDGSLPDGYQTPTELGLYVYPFEAQNACQADWDALGIQVPSAPPDDTGNGG